MTLWGHEENTRNMSILNTSLSTELDGGRKWMGGAKCEMGGVKSQPEISGNSCYRIPQPSTFWISCKKTAFQLLTEMEDEGVGTVKENDEKESRALSPLVNFQPQLNTHIFDGDTLNVMPHTTQRKHFLWNPFISEHLTQKHLTLLIRVLEARTHKSSPWPYRMGDIAQVFFIVWLSPHVLRLIWLGKKK